MGELQPEQVGGHALIDGHLAIRDAEIILGLRPQIPAHGGAGQRDQHRHDTQCDEYARADHLGTGDALPLVMLTVDRLGHVGIVRVGGQASVALLHHGDLAGIGLLQVPGLLTDRGRLHGMLHGGLMRLLRQRGRTLGRRIFAAAQRGGGGHRFVDDVGDRLQTGAGGPAHQRRLMRQVEGVGVQRQRGVGDHRGHIVGAAGPQRHSHELLRAFALIGDRGQDLLDGGILQHAAQTVRTQQPAVGRVGLADGDVGPRVDIEVAEHAHDHVALRMVARLGLGDAAGVDEMLHVAVILGHTHQVAVAQQIGAGVADMREHPVPLHQRDRRDGRAHAGQLAFALGLADDGVVRGQHRGLHHRGAGVDVQLGVVAFDMRQRTDRNRGGRVTAGVASHAVADGYEMLTSERRVLIVAADRAHIRNGRGIQEQRLRSIGRQDRHLNSKVVAPMRTGTRGARTVGAEMRCWLTTVPFVLPRSSMAHWPDAASG